MRKTPELDAAADFAFAELEKHDNDLSRLPIELQTVIIIYSVQPIIDNGGLQYLFESDFPDNPPYEVFAEAYRRIGAAECGDALMTATALFPFPSPHLYCERRNATLSEWEKLDDHPLAPLHAPFFDLDRHEDIWQKANDYARTHAEKFATN